jgi:predicted nucleotidyltransferase
VIAAERDLEWIARRVVACHDVDAVYLFGSYAKGEQTEDSDIDLLAVGPSRLPRHHRGKEAVAELASFPTRIDLHYYTAEELAEERADTTSFAATIMESARQLYCRDRQPQWDGIPTPRTGRDLATRPERMTCR